ncbi:hypothetical protein D6810_01570 [Candidatus Dojkabacteria bacterium]|uniref:SHS2 domain-containing protein n=1 Tax=Candidatus Dojkabacteria bacterium TaxID=2099670 RepID=A0A3M0YZ07_9BACT|nr:MAG: hypothetical protein D6810_01570 [Candidatus Dojkabacteria bacterium]
MPFQKKETYLSIDIGTENLKVALCIPNNEITEVVGYCKLPQSRSSVKSGIASNLKSIIEKIDEATGIALRDAAKSLEVSLPSKVIFGISGELVLGTTLEVEIERDKPAQKISQLEFEKMRNDSLSQVFEAVKDSLCEEACLPLGSIEEVDSEIISVKIDNQEVSDPIGLSGSSVCFSYFLSYAPKLHIDSIRKIAEHFRFTRHALVVEPFAICRNLDIDSNLQENCVIVDVGGGTTDVAVVSKGEFKGTRMFSIGGRAFTNVLQDYFSISFDEAEKMKISYSNQSLKQSQSKEICSQLEDPVRIWAEALEIALKNISDDNEIPYNFFFCGGGSLLPNIQEIMLSYPWQKNLNFVKFPRFNFLFPNKIKGFVDKTKFLNSLSDVAVVSLSRYYSRLK